MFKFDPKKKLSPDEKNKIMKRISQAGGGILWSPNKSVKSHYIQPNDVGSVNKTMMDLEGYSGFNIDTSGNISRSPISVIDVGNNVRIDNKTNKKKYEKDKISSIRSDVANQSAIISQRTTKPLTIRSNKSTKISLQDNKIAYIESKILNTNILDLNLQDTQIASFIDNIDNLSFDNKNFYINPSKDFKINDEPKITDVNDDQKNAFLDVNIKLMKIKSNSSDNLTQMLELPESFIFSQYCDKNLLALSTKYNINICVITVDYFDINKTTIINDDEEEDGDIEIERIIAVSDYPKLLYISLWNYNTHKKFKDILDLNNLEYCYFINIINNNSYYPLFIIKDSLLNFFIIPKYELLLNIKYIKQMYDHNERDYKNKFILIDKINISPIIPIITPEYIESITIKPSKYEQYDDAKKKYYNDFINTPINPTMTDYLSNFINEDNTCAYIDESYKLVTCTYKPKNNPLLNKSLEFKFVTDNDTHIPITVSELSDPTKLYYIKKNIVILNLYTPENEYKIDDTIYDQYGKMLSMIVQILLGKTVDPDLLTKIREKYQTYSIYESGEDKSIEVLDKMTDERCLFDWYYRGLYIKYIIDLLSIHFNVDIYLMDKEFKAHNGEFNSTSIKTPGKYKYSINIYYLVEQFERHIEYAQSSNKLTESRIEEIKKKVDLLKRVAAGEKIEKIYIENDEDYGVYDYKSGLYETYDISDFKQEFPVFIDYNIETIEDIEELLKNKKLINKYKYFTTEVIYFYPMFWIDESIKYPDIKFNTVFEKS